MKMNEFCTGFHWSLFLRFEINNIPALVQIMVWRQPGDKPLSEPMMVSLLRHICVTRPQWVNDNLLQPFSKILSKCHFDFTWFRIMTEISPNLPSMINIVHDIHGNTVNFMVTKIVSTITLIHRHDFSLYHCSVNYGSLVCGYWH